MLHDFFQDVDPDLQPISQLWRHVLDPCSSTMHAHKVSARAMEYPAVNSDFSGGLFDVVPCLVTSNSCQCACTE